VCDWRFLWKMHEKRVVKKSKTNVIYNNQVNFVWKLLRKGQRVLDKRENLCYSIQ
jgi:hypothetical protein